MFYQTLPNVILVLSILGIILLILRRLPKAAEMADKNKGELIPVEQKLSEKGLPTQAISVMRARIIHFSKRAWNFVLEAKDLKPHPFASYRIKKLFKEKPIAAEMAAAGKPQPPAIKLGEKELLELIKQEPKNLANYDLLGKHYMEFHNYRDARDIYLYLVHHQPTNADYYARLASCHFKLREYPKASENYTKSVALDSTQPNRYYNLGLALEGEGKLPESHAAFDQAARLEPANEKYQVAANRLKSKVGN